MTRKKFIKTLMGMGVSRNRAREEAEKVIVWNRHAEKVNKNAKNREWDALLRLVIENDRTVRLEVIPRNQMLSYKEVWERDLPEAGQA